MVARVTPFDWSIEEDIGSKAGAHSNIMLCLVAFGGVLNTLVDFGDEFDGGDGQMGVAGDGNKSLTKMGNSEQMAKSKFRSAKNAWGTSSGYADELIANGVELQRAQQLENWRNQQEVLAKKKEQRFMTEAFDQ
eukprot:scaffold144903_cov51-Attheya_sp.AAC.1